jgi:hypothetical protein
MQTSKCLHKITSSALGRGSLDAPINATLLFLLFYQAAIRRGARGGVLIGA